MSDEHDRSSSHNTTRRRLLRSAAVGSAVLGGVGVSIAKSDRSGGFPPNGTTSFGDTVALGNGELRTFTTETPSGEPKYHGVEFDRAALEGLPDGDALAADRTSESPTADDKYGETGEALVIHGRESLEYFVPFPDAAETPFTFLGLNWNPNGHGGGGGAWSAPHFDIHFNMMAPATIDAIDGPGFAPYDAISDEQMPAGYTRAPPFAAAERYITDMGEHVAPVDAPELPGNPDAFTNTLIQGFVGTGDGPELAFVEPMITREFLRGVRGTETYEVPQPAVYPHEQRHPTAYSVRDVPSTDSIAVVLQDYDRV